MVSIDIYMRIQLTKFLFGSVAAQGLSAVSGLLIARWMSVDDYAIFTIMMVITGAMSVLTKGGVNLGFTAIVGRTWPDRGRAAQALKAAMAERRIVSLWVLPPLLVVAGWLLLRNNASWILALSLLLLLLVQWEFDMRTRIADQILMFANRSPITQGLDALLSLLRLIGVVIVFQLSLLQSVGAYALSVLAAGFRVPFITKWVHGELQKKEAVATDSDRKEIRTIVRRQLPLEVFFVMQSQIVLGIVAWNSAVDQTASIGALGRIGQLLLPVQAAMMAFAIPSFTCAKEHLLRSWSIWSLAGGLPGMGLVVVAYLFPDALLFLIGPNYENLQYELLVCTIGVAASVLVANAWQLIAHRGWNHWAWLQVPIVLIWCGVSPLFLDLTRLDHLLWFQAGFPLGLFVVLFAEWAAVRRRGDLGKKS